MALVWRSEVNFQDLVLSLLCVDYRDQTQIIKLGGNCPYLLSHLSGHQPSFLFFNN